MSQVSVYGHREWLDPIKRPLSDLIHTAVVAAFQYPPDKRFHRFFPLAAEDFIHPPDRSERYTIIEISLFEGRSVAAKKQLIRLLYEQAAAQLGLSAQDLEITLHESPRCNWGIRGQPGDELALNYTVGV